MSNQQPIRVLTVDDHPLLRGGISGAINAQPDMTVVAEATDGEEAIALFRVHRPDITLMDLRMPKANGIDAITAIRKEWPSARIIVLTTYGGDVQALRAFKAGASGYLLKSMLRTELIEPSGWCTQAIAASPRKSPSRWPNMSLTIPSPAGSWKRFVG